MFDSNIGYPPPGFKNGAARQCPLPTYYTVASSIGSHDWLQRSSMMENDPLIHIDLRLRMTTE